MQSVEVIHMSNQVDTAIWDLIKTGENVHQWLPFIETCELQGEGEGAKRICTTDQGKDLIESILKVDQENKVFQYRIDSHNMDMPTDNIIGTMTVKSNESRTAVVWAIQYDLTVDLDPGTAADLKSQMADLMKTGLKGLDNLVLVNKH